MKYITLAPFAVIAALALTASAHSAPKIECQTYKGNWVNAPVQSCDSYMNSGGGNFRAALLFADVRR